MIYGDIPVKWNESPSGENELPGINTCVYMPDFSAIKQSGNLYAYVTNNPVRYIDPTGELAWPGEIHSAVSKYVAGKYGLLREQIIDYKFGWGRADLISTNGQVWEIKPDNERHIEIGKNRFKSMRKTNGIKTGRNILKWEDGSRTESLYIQLHL